MTRYVAPEFPADEAPGATDLPGNLCLRAPRSQQWRYAVSFSRRELVALLLHDIRFLGWNRMRGLSPLSFGGFVALTL